MTLRPTKFLESTISTSSTLESKAHRRKAALTAGLLCLTLLSACGGNKPTPVSPRDLRELNIFPDGLPSTTVGYDYSLLFTATGGTGLYDWTSSANDLPLGLTLDLQTGVLDGAPKITGAFQFTIKVESGPLVATKDFTIRVGDLIPNPDLELVSVASDGTPANGNSGSASISPDGRFVAFASFADNLASNLPGGDLNSRADVFIRDLDCGTTSLVSLASDGVTQGEGTSWLPSISALLPTPSGNVIFVVYLSDTIDLVPGDTNETQDVFVTVVRVEDAPACTLTPIQTKRVNISATGEEANGFSQQPVINATAEYVAYSSNATNLVQADSKHRIDLFAQRIEFLNGQLAIGPPRRMSTLTRFPARLADLFSENTIGNSNLVLELDSQAGRKVEIVSGTGAGQTRTIEANDGTTFIVSEPWAVNPDGTSVYRVFSTSTGGAGSPKLSADGTVIGFNLGGSFGPDDRQFAIEAVIKRFDLDDFNPVSLGGHALPANGQSNLMGLNDSGTLALFTSLANNLVEDDTNRAIDLFVRDVPVRVTERIHLPNDGTEADGPIGAISILGRRFESAAFSNSGNLAVYESSATNLTLPEPDDNRQRDVFLYDKIAGVTTRLSFGMDNVETLLESFDATISLDGSVVVFSSDAVNIFIDDNNSGTDLFVYRTGTVETPTFITREIAPAIVGAEFSAGLQTIGGSDPLFFAVQDGKLPPGVSLDPATGRIGGLPTEPGVYTFTLIVMDGGRPLRSNSRTFTLVVNE